MMMDRQSEEVGHEGDGLQKVTSQIQTFGTESDSFHSVYYTFLTR
jgi:hypothetical protein